MAIEFIGFTADHRIVGALPLADDRLSDMLNAVARVVVRNSTVEEIETGRTDRYDATVTCADFLVVVAAGRRGVGSLRQRKLVRRIRIGLGRFIVEGHLHVPPTTGEVSPYGPPANLLGDRDLLVPLTQATLSYTGGGQPKVEHYDAVLVNRQRTVWIEALDEPEEEPILAPESVEDGSSRPRYAKDFTGTTAGQEP